VLPFPEGVSEFVVQFLDDLWNNRNYKVVDDLFSDDCVSKGGWGETVGKAAFKSSVLAPLFAAFPDLKYVNHEVVQEGRRIVARWTLTGTNTGAPYMNLPAKGSKVSFSGLTMNRFGDDATLCEIHTHFDRLSLHEQLSGLADCNSSSSSSNTTEK